MIRSIIYFICHVLEFNLFNLDDIEISSLLMVSIVFFKKSYNQTIQLISASCGCAETFIIFFGRVCAGLSRSGEHRRVERSAGGQPGMRRFELSLIAWYR